MTIIPTSSTQPGLRIYNSAAATKLLQHYNGGLSIGNSTTPPTNGLYVEGELRTNGALTFTGQLWQKIATNQYFHITSSPLMSDGPVIYPNTGSNGTPIALGFNASRFFFSTGKVGIGTNTPKELLDVLGSINAANNLRCGTSLFVGESTCGQYWQKVNTNQYFHITRHDPTMTDGPVIYPNNGIDGTPIALGFVASRFVFATGSVGIGTNAPQAKLHVVGKIICEDELKVVDINTNTINSKAIKTKDITVEMNNAADYVFDENYNLKSLSEVESYVKENKHLPGFPSATEMAQNGMSVSEMSNLLLEKVEELTLHMIQLEKENASLKAKVESLEKELISMKRIFTICICLLCLAAEGFAAVTQSTAHQKAYQYIKNAGLKSEYVFLSKKAKTNTINILGGSKKVLSEDCWCFFLDENPNANWGHQCKYIYVSVANGNVKSSIAQMPPENLSEWEKSSYSSQTNVNVNLLRSNAGSIYVNGLVVPNIFSSLPQGCRKSKDFKGKSYAVIISGGYNYRNNHQRYWNDCSIYYQMLRRLYNIPRENIYVYMSDGTSTEKDLHLGSNYDHTEDIYYIDSPKDLDGDGNNDINGAALYSPINSCFTTLRSIINSEDNLFIFTTDHGAENGDLCLWNNTTLSPTQFTNMLLGIKSPISIVMEQCFSGSFVHPAETLNQLITIATAAHKNEPSSADYYGNPFSYKIACAYSGYNPETGATVNADSDSDGQITLLEAFNYARYVANDIPQYWSYGGIEYGESTVNVFSEKPNYLNNVGQLGNYQSPDATLGCDYSSLNNGAPQKNTSITGTLNSVTRSYNSGSKINVKATINNSTLTLNASDAIVIQKGSDIVSSTFTGTITRCGDLRSLEVPEDVVSTEPESKKIEDVEYIDMSDFEMENLVNIYPNPTSGAFTIDFGSENESGNQVEIADITGKIVYRNANLGQQANIDLSGNASGVYFIRAIAGDQV
ncbi:MAG: T9SS type A sorting domain-containing protein, partial [Paludibacteraceae bacterium]|nr:T9SS type A sorting domain-containing protein [Paludibacteraceae bacterium]